MAIRSASLLKPVSSWSRSSQHIRNLNIHENLSYSLLKDYCIPVPKFGVAKDKESAKKIAAQLELCDMAVKAQVLTGGRGLGKFKKGHIPGVKMAKSPDEAAEIAGKMIGDVIVTKQTGEKGLICNSVMIAEKVTPVKEYYVAIVMERSVSGPLVIASSQGGVEIEQVAKKDPDAVVKEPIDIMQGLTKKQAKKVAEKIGLGCENMDKTVRLLMNMYELFVAKDALMVEINPYAKDECGHFFALDAKLLFDDNASFRQKDLWKLRDVTQEDPKEVEAGKFDLSYIALDGNIACLVNGAGLAMGTMDIIELSGGRPANFLDVGGSATPEAVKEAFKIITSDKNVKAILVNIFGGIMRCDIIAEGIIFAVKELKVKLPIVCRLQGTNVDKAKEIIKKSGLPIAPIDHLDEAAKQAIAKAKG